MHKKNEGRPKIYDNFKNEETKRLFNECDPWGRQQNDRIDPVAAHFNKKQPVFNHPHHNFNSYGQKGDWTSEYKQDYPGWKPVGAPEPKPPKTAQKDLCGSPGPLWTHFNTGNAFF